MVILEATKEVAVAEGWFGLVNSQVTVTVSEV